MRGTDSGWKEQQEQTYGGVTLTVCSGTWPEVWFDWSTRGNIERFTVSMHVSFNLPVSLSSLLAGRRLQRGKDLLVPRTVQARKWRHREVDETCLELYSTLVIERGPGSPTLLCLGSVQVP